MAKNINRKVTIYINGREVQNTLSSIRNEIIKLEREQARLPIDSEEYIKKMQEIRSLKGILQQQKTSVATLGNTWNDATLKLAEYSNILMGLQTAFTMLDLGIGKIKDLARDAAELDDAYGRVMKTTGLTHDQVEQLNEVFKKMDTRTSREQLNQLAYEAGKLGIQGVHDVSAFVDASDKINVALGDVLGEGAMVTIGKMAQVYAKSTEELAASTGDLKKQMLTIGNAVNELGKLSTANEHYLVEFAGRMGGIAVQAGLSADEVLGFASALDQDMQKVEMSATAFQKFIGQIMKKPADFAQQAGMAVEDFAKLVKTDLNEALFKVLQGFSGRGGYMELVNIFKDLGLDGARAASVISAMANSIDKIRVAQAAANDQLNGGTSIMLEFEKMNNTMQAKAEKAKKRFQDVRVELGNELYPVLIRLQKSGTVLMKGVAGVAQLLKAQPALLVPITAAIIAWNRARIASLLTGGKLTKMLKTLTGVEKIEAMQVALQERNAKKLVAAQELERLKALQNRLAIEKETLARQQSSTQTLIQEAATKTKNRVYSLEVMVTEQATKAELAHAAATNASKTAFMSTPWGMIITALTTIAAVSVSLIKRSKERTSATKELTKAVNAETTSAEFLFKQLSHCTKGSDEYRRILNQLETDYPGILQKYKDEEGCLRNIESARRAVIASIKDEVTARMRSEHAEKLSTEYAETEFEAYAKIRDLAEKEFGQEYGPARFEQFSDALKKNMNLTRNEFIKQMDMTTKLWGHKDQGSNFVTDPYTEQFAKIYDAYHRMTNQMNDYDQVINNIIGEQKIVAESANEIEELTMGDGSEGTTGGSGKETAAERKARLAQEAWERFKEAYDRMLDKMDAKTTSGAAKVVAEVDTNIRKMKDDLEKAMATHPEAKKMLDEIEAKSTEWKNKKLDEYIAKQTAELDKQKNKLKESGLEGNAYADKIEEAQRKLQESLTLYDAAMAQAQADVVELSVQQANASAEEQGNLQRQIDKVNDLIEQYKKLKSQMAARVFDAINTKDVKASRMSRDESQWRPGVQSAVAGAQATGLGMLFDNNAFEAYGRALEEIYQKYDKQKKAIEEAGTANSKILDELMKKAEGDPQNEELQERIRLREEEGRRLEDEKNKMDNLLDSAKEGAKEDAFGRAIDKWIVGIDQFGSAATQIWGNVNKILDNMAQEELNRAKKQKEKNEAMLDEQLEQGIISQEEYDEEKEALAEEYEAKEKAVQLEQWKRQKLLNIGEATMQGALAVLQALASAPPPYNAILAGISAALAAVQIAAIASEPEPYARGGYVDRDTTFYRAGEAGPEWIASNKLLNDSRTAPIIGALEAYQRGNNGALTSIPMAQLDMPSALAASTAIGHTLGQQSSASIWEHPTAAAVGSDSRELVNLMRDLVTYQKDPKNRQAVISRRTMDDFTNQENFLRNRARL